MLVNDSLTGSCIAAAQSLVLLLSTEVLLRRALRPDFHSFTRVIVMTGWWVSAFGYWTCSPKCIAPELVPAMLSASL